MNETFTLAHLSDLHLSSLNDVKVRELLNKRIYGYLKWQLKRRAEHRREVLDALLLNLQHTTPDHIAVTGDLTHLGLPREFREARNLLQSLGSPSRVTVIPGNHDTYVSTDWNSTFALWTDYMLSDEAHLGAKAGTNVHTTFPSLRVRGIAALIGVSTARPSAPLLAVGSVGQIQLQKLEKILVETGKQRLFRVVLIHHPPVNGTVSWRKRLTDASAFRSVLAFCSSPCPACRRKSSIAKAPIHRRRTIAPRITSPSPPMGCAPTWLTRARARSRSSTSPNEK